MASFFDKFKFGKKPPTGGAKKAAAKSAEGAVSVAAPAGDRDTGIATLVLRHPHVTEKAARVSGQRQYVFVVPVGATKLQVKEAVLKLYGVRPVSVNVVRMKGKRVRFGGRPGIQKDWKKAVVTLAPGASLAIYEGV